MSEVSINFKINGVDAAATSINNLSDETKGLSTNVKDTTKSVQTYSQQIKALQKEMIALGGRTKENAAEFDSLADRIRELNDAKEDLTIGTSKLDDALRNIPGPVGAAANSFKTFDLAIKNGRSAITQLTKTFPILRNAIAATGVGALVIIFGLLVAAVIKAFNSFKPLQDAVGRMGILFDLLGEIITPLIDLIGKGLTIAVDGVSRAIAFLTGNLEEYEKKVKAAEATKALEENLKKEADLYELQKDKFNEYTQDIKAAEQELADARKKINEDYANDIATRNELLAQAEERFGRRVANIDIKRQESIRQTLKGLDRQINKVQLLEQRLRKQIETETKLLKARNVNDFTSTMLLDKLKEALDVAQTALDNTKTKADDFKKSIGLLGGGLNDNSTQVLKLLDKYKEYTTIITSTNKNTSEAKQRTFELAAEITKLKTTLDDSNVESLNTYDRNLQSIVKSLELSGLTFNQVSSVIEGLEEARRSSSLANEEKFQKEYDELEKTFIDNRLIRLRSKEKASLESIQKEAGAELLALNQKIKNNEISDLQGREEEKEIIRRAGEFIQIIETEIKIEEDRAKVRFAALTENIKNNKQFEDSIALVRKEVEKYNTELNKALESGAIDAYVAQNIEGLKALVGQDFQLTGDTFVDKPSFDAMFEALAEQFPMLEKVSQTTRDNIFKGYKESYDAIQREIDLTNVGFFTSQFDLQMTALERQKEIDKERLKAAGATTEQLLELEKNYAKQTNMINYQMVMNNVAMVGQSIGLVAEAMGQESNMYRGLKIAEGTISAIVSSIKAFEAGIEFGGPAGPVIAPILAASTFAAQMAAVARISQVPEPQSTTQTNTSIGPNPTYTGYYEDGGLVRGPRHNRGGVLSEMEGGEYVINRRSMMLPGVSEMAMTLNNMSNILSNPQALYQEPPVVKTYVLSGEITTQQRADRRIKNLSRL